MNDTVVNETISFEDYHSITGKRFRPSREQFARIEAGQLTREEALQERVLEGLEKFTRKEVSKSDWLDPDLTLENFREKTGCRFRINPDQKKRGLSRQDAFQETLTEMRH